MKPLIKTVVQNLLAWLAKRILKRHTPDIIAITGSVGKTSTKEAIYCVLQKKYTVRKTLDNYNNEFGLPLTIIGAYSGNRNIFKWASIIIKGLAYAFLPLSYPKILILEMGIDKPGDMKYLLSIARPKIGIVTTISEEPTHVEFFKDVDHLAKEKLLLYKAIPKDGYAILNLDDHYNKDIAQQLSCNIKTIGITQSADLQAIEIDYAANPHETADSPRIAGLRFKLQLDGSVVPCFIPHGLGEPVVYATLFAAAVAQIYGINFIEVTQAMEEYVPARGRMNIIPGKNNTLIIDDTYNASPAAVRAALQVLIQIASDTERIVCLGNMEELGQQSKRAHTLIGKHIAQLGITHLVTLGEKGEWISAAALTNGMDQTRVTHCKNHTEAVQVIVEHSKPQDVILVKGSQSMRLEKVVRDIMLHPEEAKQLLVRQSDGWV